MKILVADDSKATRLKLSFSLSQLGYEVQQTGSGLEALDILVGRDAPEIAILDWMMDDIEGVQVCREVRATLKERAGQVVAPYLIIITAKSGVDEITAGLDSGADDYLVKPWNDKVLGARLRVAVRTVELQKALNSQIDAMASMLRRYQLRQQAMSKLHISAMPQSELAAEGMDLAPLPSATRFSDRLAHLPSVRNMSKTISAAFSRIGCGRAVGRRITADPPVVDDNDFIVWTTLISKTGGICLELRVELEADAAAHLYKRTMKSEPEKKDDLYDALSEMVDIIQEDLRANMFVDGLELITPIQPKVVSAGGLRAPSIRFWHTDQFAVEVAGQQITLYIGEYDAPLISKSLDDLKVNDIIMAPIQIVHESQRHWFVEGTALGPAALKKLREIAGGTPIEVSVVEPTLLGRLALSM